jgi:hypothetical protein
MIYYKDDYQYNRFLIFSTYHYEGGGFDDCEYTVETIEEVRSILEKHKSRDLEGEDVEVVVFDCQERKLLKLTSGNFQLAEATDES